MFLEISKAVKDLFHKKQLVINLTGHLVPFGILIAQQLIMNRRSFDRVDMRLPIKYVCDDRLYSGTIKNLSENGMFIKTSNFLPCINWIEIFVPLEEEISKFFARIRRIEKIDDANFSMGIELLDPPYSYIEFVGNLKVSIKS